MDAAAPPPLLPHRVLDVVTRDTGETVPVELDELSQVAAEQTGNGFEALLASIKDMLEFERAQPVFWVRLIEEVWRLGKHRDAMSLVETGIRRQLLLARDAHSADPDHQQSQK